MQYSRILEQNDGPFKIYRAFVFSTVDSLNRWCNENCLGMYVIFSNGTEFAVGNYQVASDAGFKVHDLRDSGVVGP